MPAFIRLHSSWLLLAVAAVALAGCSTPLRRARQRVAAFHKLSKTDQKLVLRGHVRNGMSKDAVYIAWGAPSRRVENGRAKEAVDNWVYERRHSVYAPMGSSDQVYASPGLYGPRFGFGLRLGFGYGGFSDTAFLASPRVIETDVRLKRAEFVDDHLRLFEERRGVASRMSF